MNKIMDVIAKETGGISYKSHRFCYESSPQSGIEYDFANEPEQWCSRGETIDQKGRNVNLKDEAIRVADEESVLKYFLDGSRHTYKIDDISYDDNVYPVIAGQISVGCCQREKRNLKNTLYKRELVIALPDKASEDEWKRDLYFQTLTKIVNERAKNGLEIEFDQILPYSTTITKDTETFEKKGIARIQDAMIELEKNAVAELVSQKKLNDKSYLIKDGSLEYQKLPKDNTTGNDLTNKKFRDRYTRVIGLSKTFNPTKCYSGGDKKLDSNRVARLKPFERTPANMYFSPRAGNVWFCVWYVRLRDAKYSRNIFDGVLKVEQIVEMDEDGNGIPMPTEYIDSLTAHILNERNPVCYGNDNRWANHIYPMYLTERFCKSQYLSSDLFMEMF